MDLAVESSAIGAIAAFVAAVLKGRMTRTFLKNSVRKPLANHLYVHVLDILGLGFGAVLTGWGGQER